MWGLGGEGVDCYDFLRHCSQISQTHFVHCESVLTIDLVIWSFIHLFIQGLLYSSTYTYILLLFY